MMIQQQLTEWYTTHKRELPWRKNKTPYSIWISEVMLQQTRVNQAIAYYLRFMEAFPSVESLAEAPEQKVLKLWQGLGYYSRARNLHLAAKMIMQSFGGKFPSAYPELLSLPGIGEYTAGAIASIAWNTPIPAIDGNALRFFSRYFGIHEPVNSSKGIRIIRDIAVQLMPKQDPGTFNQAIMELGATVCKPKSPQCPQCPLRISCKANQDNLQNILPVKIKNKSIRERFLNYIVLLHTTRKSTYLIQRTNPEDIGYHLFEFPVIETDTLLKPEQVLRKIEDDGIPFPTHPVLLSISSDYSHILSHQKLNARFFTFSTETVFQTDAHWIETDRETLPLYPVSALISKFLAQHERLKEIF
ncbi:MAG: A/G-specific adenine glycosylase [Bacteroidales bacterium]|nr:A/G-specific adenine glycosylase [Bacteroidales bacterium]MDY0285490.1 A/G-specific adenine glycosylase [Bacteroidales bacterium]